MYSDLFFLYLSEHFFHLPLHPPFLAFLLDDPSNVQDWELQSKPSKCSSNDMISHFPFTISQLIIESFSQGIDFHRISYKYCRNVFPLFTSQ